jgi:hypothetical protein
MSDQGLTSVRCGSLATPRNLVVIRRKYPGHCPYHIADNLLGGSFNRNGACTTAPFSDGACVHGAHSNPELTDGAKDCKSQTAFWKLLQLPLGFSRRADSTKLYDGCRDCIKEDAENVACMSCGRAWVPSRRKGSRPVAADYDACSAFYRTELDRISGEEGGYEGQDGQQDSQEYEGQYAEQYNGRYGGNGGHYGGDEEEEGEEAWYDDGDEGGEGEEDSESSSESSSGEAEPPAKRAHIEHALPSAMSSASVAQAPEVHTLRLQLEAAQANNRALEAELKLAKSERDAALARL